MEKITISKKQVLTLRKAANRQAHIEAHIAPPKSVIFRNRKKYSRKCKHRLPQL